MNKLQAFCEIEKPGKLKLIQEQKFKEALTTMPEGRYSLKLEKLFGKRSNNQNAYYWSVVIPMILQGLQELGHEAEDAEEAHDIVKKLFLKPDRKRKRLINKNTGQYMYIQPERTTTKLNTVDFNAYIEKIARWAAEFLNIEIPEPDHNYKIM